MNTVDETTEPADLQTEERIPYLPSPEEIRQMCLLIQSEWTPQEEQSRRVQRNLAPETRWVRSAASED